MSQEQGKLRRPRAHLQRFVEVPRVIDERACLPLYTSNIGVVSTEMTGTGDVSGMRRGERGGGALQSGGDACSTVSAEGTGRTSSATHPRTGAQPPAQADAAMGHHRHALLLLSQLTDESSDQSYERRLLQTTISEGSGFDIGAQEYRSVYS